jgi:hypothetical protein
LSSACRATRPFWRSPAPARIFDRRITRAEPPYLVLGEAEARDFSTGEDEGTEHRFEIEAWTRENGRKQAVELADAVRLRRSMTPTSHLRRAALINLRHERTVSRRVPQDRAASGAAQLPRRDRTVTSSL